MGWWLAPPTPRDVVERRRAREEARERAQQSAPICAGADVALEKKWTCGHRWYKQHPKTRGGPRWHVCGRTRGHQDRHRCQGCSRQRRVDPGDASGFQARLP